MTTAYYTFQTRKVKVSGGADLLTLVPVVKAKAPAVSADGKVLAPAAFGGKLPREAHASRGEVLDFDLCRKHMETKNAWNSLRQAAGEQEEDFLDTRWAPAEDVGEQEAFVPQSKARDILELSASAAVILPALRGAAVFLALV